MGEVLKHIKYRCTLRRRQTLLIKIKLTAKHQDIVALNDVGGFDTATKSSYGAQGYLGYRTHLFQYPTILRAGYRVLSQKYQTHDFTGNTFKYDVTQRGPAIGLSVRF